MATDCELSGNENENEHIDNDSCFDNNLDHLCGTEFKLKDNVNVPGFEYISKTGHHAWLDSCKSTKSRCKGNGVDAAFLEECEEVSFVDVGGSLRAKIHTKLQSSPKSVQELVQTVA